MTTTQIEDASRFLQATLIQGAIPAPVWLAGFLRNGPRLRREVETESHQAGYRWATIAEAAALLGICEQRPGERRPWLWSLR
jgi:hypothetical protein